MTEYREISPDELEKILSEHRLWVETEEKEGARADLSRAGLRGADLRGADLSGADLSGADLRGADFSGADLSGADLWEADLSFANLSGANLSGADLRGAYLSGADLRGADLSGADLMGAYRSEADFEGIGLGDLRSQISHHREPFENAVGLNSCTEIKMSIWKRIFEHPVLSIYKRLSNILKEDLAPVKSDAVKVIWESFKLSTLYPKKFSKRFSSKIVIIIYAKEVSRDVIESFVLDIDPKIENVKEIVDEISIFLGMKVRIKISCPDLDFSEETVKLLDSDKNKIEFTCKPKDSCISGYHMVLLTIDDEKEKHQIYSKAFEIHVVDFVIDHISRPLLSKIGSGFLVAGSIIAGTLTFIGQVDKTLGVSVGTAFGVAAAGVIRNFFKSFK